MIRPFLTLRTATLLAGVGVTIWAAAVTAKTKVHTDYDKAFDFGRVRTWAWHPSGAGEVKMAVTADDNPEAVRQRFEPVIKQTVEQGMARRGFVLAEGGEPDVRVTYYLLLSVGSSAQQMGQFLPAVAAWGLPPFDGATQSVRAMVQGSLVLDVIDPKVANVVWRSVAQGEVKLDRSDAERQDRIRSLLEEMLRKFPPKK